MTICLRVDKVDTEINTRLPNNKIKPSIGFSGFWLNCIYDKMSKRIIWEL